MPVLSSEMESFSKRRTKNIESSPAFSSPQFKNENISKEKTPKISFFFFHSQAIILLLMPLKASINPCAPLAGLPFFHKYPPFPKEKEGRKRGEMGMDYYLQRSKVRLQGTGSEDRWFAQSFGLFLEKGGKL